MGSTFNWLKQTSPTTARAAASQSSQAQGKTSAQYAQNLRIDKSHSGGSSAGGSGSGKK